MSKKNPSELSEYLWDSMVLIEKIVCREALTIEELRKDSSLEEVLHSMKKLHAVKKELTGKNMKETVKALDGYNLWRI